MDNVYIGDIELVPFNFAPNKWSKCEGQLIQINQHPTLYSLLGSRYGGDGVTTFALPNLKDASPIPGMHYCISMEGLYPPRN